MKFNPTFGKIYDSIFFFIAFYNTDEIRRKTWDKYPDSECMQNCYMQLKDAVTPPELLRPLFYCKDAESSIISGFFAETFDPADTIDSFCDKLTQNTDTLYRNTLDGIFSDYQKETGTQVSPADAPEDYQAALNALRMDDAFKLQTALLFGNFPYALSRFTELLKSVYTHVDLLHARYKKEIDEEWTRIQSGVNQKLYEQMLSFCPTPDDNTIISICLIHQYIIWGDAEYLMLGLKHESIYTEENALRSPTLTDFLIACGNASRLKILYSVANAGELTLSQLSKLLQTAPTTLLRHIDVLLDSRILAYSRREGLQIFYKINYTTFRAIQPHLDGFMEIMQAEN